jgi:hypothetical protein
MKRNVSNESKKMAGREGTAPPPGDPNSPVLLLHQRPAFKLYYLYNQTRLLLLLSNQYFYNLNK